MNTEIKRIINESNNSEKSRTNPYKYTSKLSQDDAKEIICFLHSIGDLEGYNHKTVIKGKISDFFERESKLNPLDKNQFINYKGRADTEFAQRLGNIVSNVKPEMKERLKNSPDETVEYGRVKLKVIEGEYYITCSDSESKQLNIREEEGDSIRNRIREFNFEFCPRRLREKTNNQNDDGSQKMEVSRSVWNSEMAKGIYDNKCIVHSDNEQMDLYSFLNREEKHYTEGHHIVPLEEYKKYTHSIDEVWNIIPLCPLCHKRLHNAKNAIVRENLIEILDIYAELNGISFLEVFNKFLIIDNKKEHTKTSLLDYLISVY